MVVNGAQSATCKGSTLSRLHLLMQCEEINFSSLSPSPHPGAESGSGPERQSVVSRFISRGARAQDGLRVSLFYDQCQTLESVSHE